MIEKDRECVYEREREREYLSQLFSQVDGESYICALPTFTIASHAEREREKKRYE